MSGDHADAPCEGVAPILRRVVRRTLVTAARVRRGAGAQVATCARRSPVLRRAAGLAALIVMVAVSGAGAAAAVRVGDAMSSPASPAGIAAGPDGDLWFAEFDGNRIGRMTPSGVFTEFVPDPMAEEWMGWGPLAIAAGPDGNMWFRDAQNANAVPDERVLASGLVPRCRDTCRHDLNRSTSVGRFPLGLRVVPLIALVHAAGCAEIVVRCVNFDNGRDAVIRERRTLDAPKHRESLSRDGARRHGVGGDRA